MNGLNRAACLICCCVLSSCSLVGSARRVKEITRDMEAQITEMRQISEGLAATEAKLETTINTVEDAATKWVVPALSGMGVTLVPWLLTLLRRRTVAALKAPE